MMKSRDSERKALEQQRQKDMALEARKLHFVKEPTSGVNNIMGM